MDKLYHFLLCLATTTLFGWKIGTTVGLTVEATQAEDFWRAHGTLKTYWWGDTILDLVFDAFGIVVGTFIRMRLGWTL